MKISKQKISIVVLNIICFVAIAVFNVLYLERIIKLWNSDVSLNIVETLSIYIPYLVFVYFSVMLFTKRRFTRKYLYFIISLLVICTAIIITMSHFAYDGILSIVRSIAEARIEAIPTSYTREQLIDYLFSVLFQNIFATILIVLFYGSLLTAFIMLCNKIKRLLSPRQEGM